MKPSFSRRRLLSNLLKSLSVTALLGVSTAGEGWAAARVRVATTTSVEHSGLLRWLEPALFAATGVKFAVLAQGTGQTLRVLAAGDAAFGITHDPEAEAEFLKSRPDWLRRSWIIGRFVLVGPREVLDASNARFPNAEQCQTSAALIATLAAITRQSHARFVSRADRSGTHAREMALWQAAGIDPAAAMQERYLRIGQGMAAALMMANELGAFTLSDEATWLRMQPKLPRLTASCRGDEAPFRNPYALLAPATLWDESNGNDAARALRWLWYERMRIAQEFVIAGKTPFRAAP